MWQFFKRSLNDLARTVGLRLVNPIQRLPGNGPAPQKTNGTWANLDKGQLRLLFHHEQLVRTKDLSGNIVECGVASGGTLAFFYSLDREHGGNRQVWGFDTFEGFPRPATQDGTFLLNNPAKQDRYRKLTLEHAFETLKLAGLSDQDLKAVRLIKGLIPASFSEYSGEKVSFLNIDVDLYEPTLASLNFFWPLMEAGGVIIFDEYDSADDRQKWPGAKIAIDEFCLAHQVVLSRHFSGRTFLVKDGQ